MKASDAFRDPALYGAHPAFRRNPATWRPWLTFCDAIYGEPLDAEGRALFQRCTGLEYDPPEDVERGLGATPDGRARARG